MHKEINLQEEEKVKVFRKIYQKTKRCVTIYKTEYLHIAKLIDWGNFYE